MNIIENIIMAIANKTILFLITVDFSFSSVRGLSAEISEKLERVKPQTIGQASRIPGMTPAAISLLLVHLKKHGKNRQVA